MAQSGASVSARGGTGAEDPEAEHSEEGVDDQQFVAEFVASEPSGGIALEYEAKHRSEDGHKRDPLLTDLPFADDSEREQSEQRSVSVACKLVHGIYRTGVVEKIEHNDHRTH